MLQTEGFWTGIVHACGFVGRWRWLLGGLVAVIVLAIGIPTVLYLALDPSQRRRLKAMRNRQIGS